MLKNQLWLSARVFPMVFEIRMYRCQTGCFDLLWFLAVGPMVDGEGEFSASLVYL